MAIKSKLNSLGEYLNKTINHTHQEVEYTILPLGIIGLIGFPLNYFIWTYIFPQPYESILLTTIATILCLGLVLKKYWPNRWIPHFPSYWLFTMLYIMPFFFTIMLLKNHGAVIWVMAMVYATFLLTLILDWLSLLTLSIAGSFLGWLFYYLTTPIPTIPDNLLPYIFGFIFNIATGTLLNYKGALIQQKKLEAMAALSTNIAHELRTPLLGIKSGTVGLKKYLPILFDSYSLAKQSGLPVTTIRSSHFNNLLPALDRMESETNYANIIIDMLLMNASKTKIDTSEFVKNSIVACVNQALIRYPFNSDVEKEKVHWDTTNDFEFYGSSLLIIHVIFNLLKNALHFIVKGDEDASIYIWSELGEKFNILHFKDTGSGIPTEAMPRLFERFFTTTLTGTGIGLSFCKAVMTSLNGKIECTSEEGKYTEFLLSFPTIDKFESLS